MQPQCIFMKIYRFKCSIWTVVICEWNRFDAISSRSYKYVYDNFWIVALSRYEWICLVSLSNIVDSNVYHCRVSYENAHKCAFFILPFFRFIGATIDFALFAIINFHNNKYVRAYTTQSLKFSREKIQLCSRKRVKINHITNEREPPTVDMRVRLIYRKVWTLTEKFVWKIITEGDSVSRGSDVSPYRR